MISNPTTLTTMCGNEPREWALNVTREILSVTGAVPDMGWRALCQKTCGYPHCWQKRKGTFRVTYTHHVRFLVCVDEDGEEIFGHRYLCRRCRRIIHPRYKQEQMHLPGIQTTEGTVCMTRREYQQRRKNKTFQLSCLIPQFKAKCAIVGLLSVCKNSGPIQVHFTVVGKLIMRHSEQYTTRTRA